MQGMLLCFTMCPWKIIVAAGQMWSSWAILSQRIKYLTFDLFVWLLPHSTSEFIILRMQTYTLTLTGTHHSCFFSCVLYYNKYSNTRSISGIAKELSYDNMHGGISWSESAEKGSSMNGHWIQVYSQHMHCTAQHYVIPKLHFFFLPFFCHGVLVTQLLSTNRDHSKTMNYYY